MDADETLYHLLRAAFSGATVKVGRVLEGGGSVPLTFVYRACVKAPNIGYDLKTSAATAQEVEKALRAAWPKARRAYDTGLVLSECRRLSEGNLDLDQQAVLENELLHCHWTAFEGIAARARKSAQALAPSYSQAA
jgi:hypothetical protein